MSGAPPVPAAPAGGGALPIASYPGRVAIDAYGNGGFRFGGLSHRGSLLVMPDRTCAWDATAATCTTLALLAPVLGELASPWFLLLGTGRSQIFPGADVRRAFAEAGIGLEAMDTGGAARTYNVLLAEGRPVAAALTAV